MSFFSFLPSPGPILRDLANCLPSALGAPATGRDSSVLDYLSAVLPSVAYGLFPSVPFSSDNVRLSWGSSSLLSQFPPLLLHNDQQRDNHTPLWLPTGSPPYTP